VRGYRLCLQRWALFCLRRHALVLSTETNRYRTFSLKPVNRYRTFSLNPKTGKPVQPKTNTFKRYCRTDGLILLINRLIPHMFNTPPAIAKKRIKATRKKLVLLDEGHVSNVSNMMILCAYVDAVYCDNVIGLQYMNGSIHVVEQQNQAPLFDAFGTDRPESKGEWLMVKAYDEESNTTRLCKLNGCNKQILLQDTDTGIRTVETYTNPYKTVSLRYNAEENTAFFTVSYETT
jgi:hypothetical protein